jgi:hypothetical protein
VRIFITAIGRGSFQARDESGKLLCTSGQPFLDAARALLALGVDPDTELVWLSSGGLVRLKGAVGKAAKWTVEEGDRPPHFRRWKPNLHYRQKAQESAAVASPIELAPGEAPQGPVTEPIQRRLRQEHWPA